MSKGEPVTTSLRFQLLGEPLALDLANTRVRSRGAEVDLLDSRTALAAWLGAERQRIAWRGKATQADLDAVRELRDAIDCLLRARRARTRPPRAALACVNRALAANDTQPRLIWNASGPALAAGSAHAQRVALLRELARDGVALLTGPDAGRVRECAHPDCRLQFLALNARRRWCSSATCGNRARVAEHYRRRHPGV